MNINQRMQRLNQLLNQKAITLAEQIKFFQKLNLDEYNRKTNYYDDQIQAIAKVGQSIVELYENLLAKSQENNYSLTEKFIELQKSNEALITAQKEGQVLNSLISCQEELLYLEKHLADKSINHKDAVRFLNEEIIQHVCEAAKNTAALKQNSNNQTFSQMCDVGLSITANEEFLSDLINPEITEPDSHLSPYESKPREAINKLQEELNEHAASIDMGGIRAEIETSATSLLALDEILDNTEKELHNLDELLEDSYHFNYEQWTKIALRIDDHNRSLSNIAAIQETENEPLLNLMQQKILQNRELTNKVRQVYAEDNIARTREYAENYAQLQGKFPQMDEAARNFMITAANASLTLLDESAQSRQNVMGEIQRINDVLNKQHSSEDGDE